LWQQVLVDYLIEHHNGTSRPMCMRSALPPAEQSRLGKTVGRAWRYRGILFKATSIRCEKRHPPQEEGGAGITGSQKVDVFYGHRQVYNSGTKQSFTHTKAPS
jgi:hypothetical protein